MPDVTLIGLGFQGNANNRFQSVNPNQAPGSAAFYASVLVNIQESLLSAPVEASYFGNFVANVGWDIGRAADTPASDPPNTPEIVTIRARFGLGGSTTTLTYSTDASSIFGRTHLIGVSLVGLVATLYVNGAAVAQETLGGALTLGNTGLTYGNVAGGGLRSGDPVISAAYSDSDAANFILEQRALFEGVRTSGKLAATIAALGLSAAYIYESFQQKSPTSGLPTTPLKNFGVAGTNGDLIFAGSAPLVINADPDPDYTGGAQSSTTGPGAVNLQDAYDAGPTGLIVTGGPGPFGVDDLRVEGDTLSSVAPNLQIVGFDDAAAPGSVDIRGGNATVNDIDGGAVNVFGGSASGGDAGGGSVLVRGGSGFGTLNGGDVNLLGGTAFGSGAGGATQIVGGPSSGGTGGLVLLRGADGSVSGTQGLDGGSASLLGGAGGASSTPDTGGAGGSVTIQSGAGGGATGAAATAGTPGDIIILAGAGGPIATSAAAANGGNIAVTAGAGSNAEAGDTAGNGGQLVLITGAGGDATGAGATCGNGGELNLTAGPAGNALGGAVGGVGGALILSAGNGEDGIGGAVQISSGGGDAQSGNLDIFTGSSPGVVGLLSVLGGAALGLTSGPGGGVVIAGGEAAVGAGQDGGNVSIDGGLGDDAGGGGNVSIEGGTTHAGGGPGGAVSLVGGDGGSGGVDNGGFGGDATVSGGNAVQPDQPAGSVSIEGGDASGAGAPSLGGNVHIRGGTGTNSIGGQILITSGSGSTELNAGDVEVALSNGTGGPTATVGGFFLDATNGRLSLRTYAIGGGVDAGSLRLHQVNTAGEAVQVVDDGLLHYQTQQAAGVATTIGFRAARSGNYGLMGRVYNRTFVTADAPGDTLTITHNLDCITPGVAVYDPAGAKVFENPAGLAGVVVMSADVLELTFAAAFITAGTWTVSVFAY